jgi:hypothetical protein
MAACSEQSTTEPAAEASKGKKQGSQSSESSSADPSSEEEPADPNSDGEVVEENAPSPAIPPEELEERRAQVLKQVDDIRAQEISVGGAFGFVGVPNPVPATVPGTEVHTWTPDDTGAMGTLSWAPRASGGGSTYAQFQVQVPEDGTRFTVIATMDLDGDGVNSTAQATESKPAWIVDSSLW